MNILKRGKISITKQPIKTAIFLLIVGLIGIVIAGAVIVNQALVQTAEHIRLSTPTVVVMETDEIALHERYTISDEWFFNELEPASIEAIKEVGQLPYVRSFDYSFALGMLSTLEDDFPQTSLGDGGDFLPGHGGAEIP